MTKKTKKAKDELIDSLLEDLKEDDSSDESLRIGPNGIEASGAYSPSKDEPVNEDKTTLLLTAEEPAAQYVAEFFVEDDKSKPIKAQALQMNIPQEAKLSAREKLPPTDSLLEMPKPAPMRPAESKTPPGANQQSFKATAFESQFARAENLKVAQQRILELEQYIEKYRKENEMLGSAGEISKNRIEDLISKSLLLEKQKNELKELNESELRIFKDGLVSKDSEIHRLRTKVEELESRLANDLRKVRVRERELENRLELAKVERTALLRAKDETILELKRKTENLQGEIEGYQNKIIDLGKKIETNQEQFARTVRALRLALTNLEVNEGTNSSITLTPLKKAD
jgi:hypothetical protein